MNQRPNNSTEVTVDWLNQVLTQSGVLSEAKITNVEASDLGEGVGLMAEVVRLKLDYDRPDADAPASMIAKFPTPDEANLNVATMQYFYPREIGFYTQLAQHSPIHTARLYHAELDMSDHGFALLLEDFADATAGDQVAGTTPEQTATAISEIGKLHGAWWGKVDAGPMTELFDFANPEFTAAVQAGYESFIDDSVTNFAELYSDYTRETAIALGPKVSDLMLRSNHNARTFVHGDYRADNMMFGEGLGEANFAALDWQISGRGGALYDVAYLICNSVPREYRAVAEKDLLRQYHETLLSMGVENYSFAECWENYREAVLAGLFVAVYVSGGLDLGNERGVEAARAILRRVDAAVNDLQAGDFLPD